PAVDRERRHVSAIRNYAERENRRRRDQNRRKEMDDLVRARRNDVFLDQHFNSVGDRLKKSKWADAVRPVTILHPPENFSLEHRDEREKGEKHSKKRGNVQQAGNDLNGPIRRATRSRRKQRFFCADEDLINSVGVHVTILT